MVRNDERRLLIADTAIAVLADAGARGLTFRAVDAEAQLPRGTTSNYFRARSVLVGAVIDRIGARLAPNPDTLRTLGRRTPGPDLFADYVRDIIDRLLGDREATTALFELRLNAARDPEIGERIGHWLRTAFAADVAFNADAGLPGGRLEIALFHYAIDGYILDRLTMPIAPDIGGDPVIDTLVNALFGPRTPQRP